MTTFKDLKIEHLNIGWVEVETYAANQTLVSLEGIEAFPETTLVRCSHQPNLADCSALGQLSNLEHLSLEYNPKIDDIRFISKLRKLKTLNISATGIKDLSPLKDLEYLYRLEITDLQLDDQVIEVLAMHPNLWSVNLRNNQITSLQVFENTPELQELYLSENQIENLEPLKRLPKLSYLSLDGNLISDINPLECLTSLEFLELNKNQINDISPLQSLTKLQELYLNENQITDVSPLENLTELRILELGNNQLKNIQTLKKLVNLTRFSIFSNQVTDASVLTNFEKLQEISLEFNEVKGLDELFVYFRKNKNIDKIDLYGFDAYHSNS